MISATPRLRARPLGIVLSLVFGFVVRPDAAEAVRIVVPAGGEHLAAGQVVEVRWDGLPDDVDEMELLLDVNGTTPQRVRLTPQLAGAARAFRWQVPNLPAQEARLRLRWGRDGLEVEGEPSAPFTIVPDTRSPTDGIHVLCGELWIGSQRSIRGRLRVRNGRMIHGSGNRAFPGATSEITEVSPPQFTSRQNVSLQPVDRLGCSACVIPGITARCPLTFPLRP